MFIMSREHCHRNFVKGQVDTFSIISVPLPVKVLPCTQMEKHCTPLKVSLCSKSAAAIGSILPIKHCIPTVPLVCPVGFFSFALAIILWLKLSIVSSLGIICATFSYKMRDNGCPLDTGEGNSREPRELGWVIGDLLFLWEKLLQSHAFKDQFAQGLSKVGSSFRNAVIWFRATIIIIEVTSAEGRLPV